MGELSADEDELSLTAVMNLLVDINTHLSTNEQCLDHLGAKRTAEQGGRDATRRCVMTGPREADHHTLPDIPDKVWAKVTMHLRGAPARDLHTTDDNSGSDEEVTTPAPKRRGLKSGKVCTMDTTVKRITWPHDVMYTGAGQPKVFEDMSISLFVSGYLMVMAGERDQVKPHMIQHLQDLMKDVESYGSETV